VAILGLARATLQSVHVGDLDDHQTSTRLLLPVSLAFDHRVIDGAEAARFVRRLGERLADLEDFVLDT
jgi:pyruvate dehydrogenase E2 component (dihydrolipoamide acetyltransferase)